MPKYNVDLIDCEIEDGGEGREEIAKEPYVESEDFHGKSQRNAGLTTPRRPNKRILQKKQSQIIYKQEKKERQDKI